MLSSATAITALTYSIVGAFSIRRSLENGEPLGAERILVVGAGSLGSVYGGFLARAGFEVELLAREAHARAVQAAGGLGVESFGERFFCPCRAEWRPERVGPAEIVVVLTKTIDTEAALAGLDQVCDSVRLAVSLQNGVEKDSVLAGWCGPERVVGGVSMVGGTLGEPGHVRHTFRGATFLGELPEGTSRRVERFGEMLETAGLESVVTDRVLSAEWSKLAQAVPPMSLAALTRLRFHELLLAPELADLFAQLTRETVAVAVAAGVEVDDWPSMFPVKTLAALPHEEAVTRIQDLGRRLEAGGMTDVKISMLQSVERGRLLEVEAVQGFVAREGRRLGVPVQGVETCCRLLAGMNRHFA